MTTRPCTPATLLADIVGYLVDDHTVVEIEPHEEDAWRVHAFVEVTDGISTWRLRVDVADTTPRLV